MGCILGSIPNMPRTRRDLIYKPTNQSIGYLPADYIQLGMCTLFYYTTFWDTIENVLTRIYGVSPQGLRQKM